MAVIAFLNPYLRTEDPPESPESSSDLVQILILSALQKLEQARMAHDSGRWVEKGFYLGRASGIVDALHDVLQLESAGPSARELGRIYNQIPLYIQTATLEENQGAVARAREAICRLSACWQAQSCRTAYQEAGIA